MPTLPSGVGASLLLPEKEASAAGDVESDDSSSQSDEATGLLGAQGTVKKRANGKARLSEDSDSLLVVVPDAEADGSRRSMDTGPTDSMDDNNVVGAGNK